MGALRAPWAESVRQKGQTHISLSCSGANQQAALDHGRIAKRTKEIISSKNYTGSFLALQFWRLSQVPCNGECPVLALQSWSPHVRRYRDTKASEAWTGESISPIFNQWEKINVWVSNIFCLMSLYGLPYCWIKVLIIGWGEVTFGAVTFVTSVTFR